MGIIYLARNTVNGKCYVGQTINLKQRMDLHKGEADGGSPFIFHCAIRKHGWDAFEWSILYQDDDNDKDWMNWWERKFVRELQTKMPNGYNMTDGGGWRGTGWKHTDESNEKNRNAHLNVKQSEETIKKRSKSLTGRPVSEETRRKISESVKAGYTEEHKQKTADSNKARVITDNLREKMRLSHLGKPSKKKGIPLSEEAKDKIRKKLLGRKLSDEHKTNISNGLKKYQEQSKNEKNGNQAG